MTTIAQSDSDPDFVAVIGADPEQPDFGEIVNRVDMPNVGDELHHFGYSADQQRLIVPGCSPTGSTCFDIDSDGVDDDAQRRERRPRHRQRLRRPPRRDGDARDAAGADDRRGQRRRPSPAASSRSTTAPASSSTTSAPGRNGIRATSGPTYMYDFAMTPDAEYAISTTFGSPAQCAPGIDPTCLGDEVAVWDVHAEEGDPDREPRYEQRRADGPVHQRAGGAAGVHQRAGHERRVARRRRRRRRRVRVPAGARPRRRHRASRWTWSCRTTARTSTCRTGSATPCSGSTSATRSTRRSAPPSRCRTPTCCASAADNSRLYVTNSLLTPWDNDPDFGDPRNSDYGIWLFDVDTSGDLTPLNADGSAWVSFTNVEKQTTTGPAGPHMMLFDPSIPLESGEH